MVGASFGLRNPTYADAILQTGISPRLFPPLLQLFFSTYPYYHDRNSRRAVQRCIRSIFASGVDPRALEGFVKTIQAETAKPGLSPANAFVLVEWCSIILQELAETDNWNKWGTLVVECNGWVLDKCLGEATRSNVKHSALVVTRRGLRKVFSKQVDQPKIINEVIQKLCGKGPQPSTKNAVMLGVVAGVCARKPEAKEILTSKKSEFYAYYLREIVGSRTTVPTHVSTALEDFFVAFTTKEDLEKDVIPALEKALLRAPEIILNDLLTRVSL